MEFTHRGAGIAFFSLFIMLAFASAEPFIRAAPVQDVWYANNVTEYKIVISADTSVPEGVAIAGARVRYEIPVAYPYVLTLKRVELRPSGDIFNGINSLDVLDSSNLSFNRRALSGTINNRTGNLAFLWFTLDLDYHGGSIYDRSVELDMENPDTFLISLDNNSTPYYVRLESVPFTLTIPRVPDLPCVGRYCMSLRSQLPRLSCRSRLAC
ncbi:MAG: hypothetical protein AABX12_03560 [Nanoarchaeota archaeon]